MSLSSEPIAQRHFAAQVMEQLAPEIAGTRAAVLFQVFGIVQHWLTATDSTPPLLHLLEARCADPVWRASVLARASATFPETWHEMLESWLDALPSVVGAALRRSDPRAEALAELIRHNVLPRFAFPLDVVSLTTSATNSWNWERGEELQRDLQVAISEYAPGAEVVVDGKVWRSEGVYDAWTTAPDYSPTHRYAYCRRCNSVALSDFASSDDLTVCDCGNPFNTRDVLPVLTPAGFKAGGRATSYRGGGLEWAGRTSEARLLAGNSVDRAALKPGLSVPVGSLAGPRTIHVVNEGPDPINRGFNICSSCGGDLTVRAGRHWTPGCRGAATRVGLLHSFETDVLTLAFDLPLGLDASFTTAAGRTTWRSLATAIVRSAAPYLQIDPEEIACGVRTWIASGPRELGEIFVYDDVPNGAGYARQIEANIVEILEVARTRLQVCACDRACYDCLLDYYNQSWHESLDRFAAVNILDAILDGRAPAIAADRTEHCRTVLMKLLGGHNPELATDESGTMGVRVSGAVEWFLVPRPALSGTPAQREPIRVVGQIVKLYQPTDYQILREPVSMMLHLGLG